MKLPQAGSAGRAMSEINVTPLVDVMLVLLIIFMVAAPMIQRGIDLDLPETHTGREIEQTPVIVSVNRDGALFINDRLINAELFSDQIRKLFAGREGEPVYLRADRDLPYGRVLGVMDQIRMAGIDKISMVTNPAPERAIEKGTKGRRGR